MIHSPICIVGAGPAGAAAALRLAKDGQPCLVIDKATFPREKICGDGLTSKTVTQLRRLDPDLFERFAAQPFVERLGGIKIFANEGKPISFAFNISENGSSTLLQGLTAKRVDFDNFLVQEMKTKSSIQVIEGISINRYEKVADGYILYDAQDAARIRTSLLIVADGAHSPFSRHVMGYMPEPRHYAASVRAYYSGVTPITDKPHWEAYFLPELGGGYMWIFSLANGDVNVGIAALSARVAKKKVNIKELLEKTLATHPLFKDRFAAAQRVGAIAGFGIPIGTKRRRLSGDNFMIAGDAAYLVDSLTGEGIGNALISGVFAAEQALKCAAAQDFSHKQTTQYDTRVWRVIGAELKISTLAMRLVQNTFMVKTLFNLFSNNKRANYFINFMANESEVYKHLRSWRFYWKLITLR